MGELLLHVEHHSFGHLIKWGLLAHELVQQHLIKPLINYHTNPDTFHAPEAFWVSAIHQLFTIAGNTLL